MRHRVRFEYDTLSQDQKIQMLNVRLGQIEEQMFGIEVINEEFNFMLHSQVLEDKAAADVREALRINNLELEQLYARWQAVKTMTEQMIEQPPIVQQ
jgi:hypothetical protein